MLQCEHCKRVSLGDNRGWIAFKFEHEHEDEPVLLVYCPQCAEQFEDDPSRPRRARLARP